VTRTRKKKRAPVKTILLLTLLALLVGLGIWGSVGVDPGLLRLEQTLELLELDHELFWRQRASLDLQFEGTRIRTDEQGFRLPADGQRRPVPARPFRVLALGASPTFGYGVQYRQTYPVLAGGLLRRAHPNLRVLNAGQIGYSSLQGLRLLRRHAKRWAPDLMTVSYMVNDTDRMRFFLSNGKPDDETTAPGETRVSITNFLDHFWPTAALKRHKRRVLHKLLSGLPRRGSYEMSRRRTSAASYERNLRAFVARARKMKVPLVFIKMPFRLPGPLPPDDPRLAEQLQQVQRALDQGRHRQGLAQVEALLKHAPHLSRAHYLRGRLLQALEREGYKQAYRRAMKAVIYDCARDARRYNAIMERVARDSNVPLVDAARALNRQRTHDELFVPRDYIHPSPAGHRLMAPCLTRVIERVMAGEAGWIVDRCDPAGTGSGG
jgi:lysophospholipase L1-like esterase